MFSIQGLLTSQSKLHDELQTPQPDRKISDLQPHQSQLNQSITQIAAQLGRHKSTIGRELSRNAQQVDAWVKREADVLLCLQWSPEQIAGKLPVSHEALYLHVHADKAKGGKLWKRLSCQKQKRKRYAGGHDRRGRGQIPNRRPLSERRAHV